jgi:hypothetical protein
LAVLTSSSNPYRPPSDLPQSNDAESESAESAEGWPIGFTGKLEALDGQAWLDSWKSQRIIWIVKDGAFAIAVMVGLAFYWVQVTGRDIHIWPIMYFVAGLFMLQPYQTLIERWSNKRSMKASLQAFENSKPCQGGFGFVGGYWRSEHLVVKFTWDCVQSASVGFNALAFTFWGTDWSIYLPSRFFASAADYHRLSLFLYKRFVSDPEHLPRMEHLKSIDFAKTEVCDNHVANEVLTWTELSGPFASQAPKYDESETFRYEYWPAEHRSKKEIFKSIAEHFGYSMKQYLPIHWMLICWLLADRVHYGNWGFVFSRASLLFWGFYLFALGRAFTEVFASYRGHVRQLMKKVTLIIDPVNLCNVQGDFVMWVPFQDRMELIETESEIGWEVPGEPEWRFVLQRKLFRESEAIKLKEILAKSPCGERIRS